MRCTDIEGQAKDIVRGILGLWTLRSWLFEVEGFYEAFRMIGRIRQILPIHQHSPFNAFDTGCHHGTSCLLMPIFSYCLSFPTACATWMPFPNANNLGA